MDERHRRTGRLCCTVMLVAWLALLSTLPSEALASHVGCGATLTQSTTLDSDIVDCGGDFALRIAADDVVLDLNGHTIDGVGSSVFGVYAPSANRVTITNGTIRQFAFGIILGDSDDPTPGDNVVRDLQLVDMSSSGIHVYAQRNRLEAITSNRSLFFFSASNNVVQGSDAPIVIAQGSNDNLFRGNTGAVLLRDSTGNRLRDNHFVTRPEGGIGLYLIDAVSNLIERNTASGVERGFLLERSDRNQLRENSATSRFGIQLLGGSENVIEKNRLTRSDHSGIGVQLTSSSRSNVIDKNTISGHFIGVLAEFGASRNVVSKNDLTDNTVALEFSQRASSNEASKNSILENAIGISIETGASANRLLDNVISSNIVGIRAGFEPEEDGVPPTSGNRIERNSVSDSVQDGIWIVNASGTLIERNLANRNGDDGIDVSSASNTITANIADGNRDLGIDAAPGNTDGGGNRASGNGNSLQCRGVVCR